MNFYTNVYQKGDRIYLRGYKNGKQVEEIIKYKPYLFIPSDGGFYRTIDGKSVDKKIFDSITDAKNFIKTYTDVDGFSIYGLNNFQYLYLYDNYVGEIQYDKSLISIVSLDIECAADEGFPDIQSADKEITAITIRKNGKSIVFGCGSFTTDDKNITYIKCKNEKELLEKFLEVWNHKSIKPDIITGWNIEFFDVPYLYNRITNILGERNAKRLSPWNIVESREIIMYDKPAFIYNIIGISNLDYFHLYKKFTFGNQESYALNYIAQVELGKKKLDYTEYGNLLELYKKNFQKFIEYNIQDVILVDELEEKLKFIEQVLALAYDAKVNYSDTFTTVRPWDVIIHNYLLDRRIVIPQVKKGSKNAPNVGGYVKDPKIGLSNWVVSFDLNSLYPHLIMQYNISPETFIAKQQEFPSIDEILEGKFISEDMEYSIAANGCMYTKSKQGFLPALMEKMYNDRVEYKNKMIEAKKEYEKTKDPQLIKDIARYHNFQLAKKIQLNSAYGALANEYFRWFDIDHAEAITVSGQLAVRWVEKKLNEFMNKVLKTDNKDYIIAIDTDSVYLEMGKLVEQLGDIDPKQIVEVIDKFCESKVQKVINDCYQELFVRMNAYQQKMFMKRETIADKGIWTGKKHYLLNAWNIEGVQYDKPKLKIQGLEAIKSSTPQACRKLIKDALEILMLGDELKLHEYILNAKNKFITLPFEEIAFPRGLQGTHKYKDDVRIYKKGTPIAVRAALLFNHMLKKSKIKQIQPYQDGDKIKFAYLKVPNPVHENVFAANNEMIKRFNLEKYIDYELQFQKGFVDPLKAITDVIGWQVEKTSSLEDFFV
jgi:DNA polymerase elongation subunit (family B)